MPRYHTLQVLGGAYRGKDLSERTLYTHLVDADSGKTCSGVKPENICDIYGETPETCRAIPTCPVCARKYERLQKRGELEFAPHPYDEEEALQPNRAPSVLEQLETLNPDLVRFPGYLGQSVLRALAAARRKRGINPQDQSRDAEAIRGAIEDIRQAEGLTPNRTLIRHKLESLVWEKTPSSKRGGSGSRREVLLDTTDGTGMVPLSELTDYQLRRYIGPGALEEAGDMRKNGSEEDLSFDLQKYGENMQHWHSGMDPIYAVGSYASSGKIHPSRDTIESALSELERMLRKPHSSWKAADKRELRDLIAQTQEILDTLPAPRSAGGNIEIEEFDAPAYWAPALINGDMSIFSDKEEREFDAWQAKHPELGWVVSASDEPHIGRWNGLQTELLTYTAHLQNKETTPNASRSRAPADETAARELCLFIENESSLVGAPNSQGKAIEKNLLGHLRKGRFDIKLAEKAYMHLAETGAKKYCKDFGGTWSTMFSVQTRELVAHYFATTFYEEYKLGNKGS